VPNPLDILIWFVVFVFSLSFHEASHAFTSSRFGDDTGRHLGRISMNPIVHIDPIGTVLFPLIGVMAGGFMFGWAKPVPVNPLNWREKNKANICVSAAGPLSNFLLFVIFFAIMKGFLYADLVTSQNNPLTYGFSGVGAWEPVVKFVAIGLFLNLLLGIFNLFPIPPLDGSHVLESLLPYEAAQAFEQIKPYGFILLILLMSLGVFGFVIRPIFRWVYGLLLLGF
jgi:Zn-dependent protease